MFLPTTRELCSSIVLSVEELSYKKGAMPCMIDSKNPDKNI